MNVQYYIRESFGNNRRYINRPEQAKAYYSLFRRKTVSDGFFKHLATLGVEWEKINDPDNLSF